MEPQCNSVALRNRKNSASDSIIKKILLWIIALAGFVYLYKIWLDDDKPVALMVVMFFLLAVVVLNLVNPNAANIILRCSYRGFELLYYAGPKTQAQKEDEMRREREANELAAKQHKIDEEQRIQQARENEDRLQLEKKKKMRYRSRSRCVQLQVSTPQRQMRWQQHESITY